MSDNAMRQAQPLLAVLLVDDTPNNHRARPVSCTEDRFLLRLFDTVYVLLAERIEQEPMAESTALYIR
jgi:hypothetical protein